MPKTKSKERNWGPQYTRYQSAPATRKRNPRNVNGHRERERERARVTSTSRVLQWRLGTGSTRGIQQLSRPSSPVHKLILTALTGTPPMCTRMNKPLVRRLIILRIYVSAYTKQAVELNY